MLTGPLGRMLGVDNTSVDLVPAIVDLVGAAATTQWSSTSTGGNPDVQVALTLKSWDRSDAIDSQSTRIVARSAKPPAQVMFALALHDQFPFAPDANDPELWRLTIIQAGWPDHEWFGSVSYTHLTLPTKRIV